MGTGDSVMSVVTNKTRALARILLKNGFRDRESAVTTAAIASLSSMTAVTLYNEGERKAELEVRGREEEKGLVFTVDHNNFLPCLTVSLAGDHAGTRIQYRPV